MKINPNTHFYLYAKGWYEMGNTEDDMKRLMHEYSGTPMNRVDLRDILSHLSSLAWEEIQSSGNPEYHFTYYVSRCVSNGIIEATMSLLATVKTEGKKIGRPDFNLFNPYNEKAIENSKDPAYKWAE
jgi:hypothetical protein